MTEFHLCKEVGTVSDSAEHTSEALIEHLRVCECVRVRESARGGGGGGEGGPLSTVAL